MDQPCEEGACREHHGPGPEFDPDLGSNPNHPIAFQQEVVYSLLEQGQVGLVLEPGPDGAAVQHPVRLGTGRADRRPFGRIQGSELDPGFVRRQGHRASQRINLPDEMSLADPADGRVA